MKTVENYRADMLTILGDATGRRYSESMLDMGLREALKVYGVYCPRKDLIKQRVVSVDDTTVELPGFLYAGMEILTVRNDSGDWFDFSAYYTPDRIYLNLYRAVRWPAVGDMLTMEVSGPHTVKGMDGQTVTTVPDAHSLAVASGAAGYSMRIRARSVTEVFGKRPEDREALVSQADALVANFERELGCIQPASHDPLPRGGFPI